MPNPQPPAAKPPKRPVFAAAALTAALAALVPLVCLFYLTGRPGNDGTAGGGEDRLARGSAAPSNRADPNDHGAAGSPHNIVFLLSDDQDARSLASMPNVQKLLVGQGKTFENATFAQPLCCPSRATMLTGRYPHNTGIYDNQGEDGGHDAFVGRGLEGSTYATWLDGAGYETGYFGKYMNGYADPERVPPGWDRWAAAVDLPSSMRLSDDGHERDLQGGYETFDLAIADLSLGFLEEQVGAPEGGPEGPEGPGNPEGEEEPFFMVASFSAPHTELGMARYEERYENRFEDARWPRTPNFAERDRSDKPGWVRQMPRPTAETRLAIDRFHRARLRSLLTVDDAVGRYAEVLEEAGELDDTYFFYFSDNGYHMGNHSLPDHGKNTPYTEDVEFPLVVRGPGVSPGSSDPRLVSNADIPATFADIAGTEPATAVDGRSLLPPMMGREPAGAVPWRDALLVEGKPTKNYPENWPAYEAVRTKGFAYHYYAETGEEELYDLRQDPYQLESLHDDPEHAAAEGALRRRLEEMRDCAGEGCRRVEAGRP